VLHMRLATNETYLDKDKQRQTRTDWHNLVIWGKRGEALAKILAKGATIYAEGSMRTSSYDDREGNKRYKNEVIATNIILLGNRGGHDGDAPAPRQESLPARGSAPAQRGGYGGRGVAAPRQAPAAEPPADDYDGYGGDPSTDPF